MLNLLLKDIARNDKLSVPVDTHLASLIHLMNENQKGVVVVLDGAKPAGILTERDIVEILYKGTPLDEPVLKYAKKTLVTTKGERTVAYALNLTLENKIRRVIVVDESGDFLGLVTQQDLLKYLEEDFYRLTIKVKHILKKTEKLLSVSPDEPLRNALKTMYFSRISSVPVLKRRKPVGIISEKDILRLTTDNVSLDSPVRTHMNSPVDTAVPDSLLVEVVEVMNNRNIRRMVIVDERGHAVNIVTIRDVVENLEGDYNKFLERKLSSAKEILNLLPEMLMEVTDTGKEQLIIWVNDKVANRFGRNVLDKPVTSLLPHDTWKNIHGTLIKLGKIEHIKLKIGESVFELSGFYLSAYGSMEQGRFQLIMRDVTEDIKLTTIDPLTDIYNRRFLNGFLMKELERSRRLDRHFSIVISDIDDFKRINDSYGHLAGDFALKSLAGLLMGTVRKLDVVGRYGGDEFMLILPDTDGETARAIVSRLMGKMEAMKIPVSKKARIAIAASFGIACYPEDGTSIDDLLVTADSRLYQAKSHGKNRISSA